MRRRASACGVVLAVAAAAGCSSILPKAPPRTYYDLEYAPELVPCARSYSSTVVVWPFSAAAPYDRADMVVTDGREVSFSRAHAWVDRPGVLVAQHLMRDLGGGGLFPLAVSPRDPEGASLQLSGSLYRFGWEKDGASAHASLDAEVILRRTGDGPAVLFHRRYDLRSEPLAGADDSAVFARAMSGVVARLSTGVRRDLCAALEERAAAPGAAVPSAPGRR